MNCREFDDAIGGLLSGAAASTDEAAPADHFRSCAKCARRTNEILAVHELLLRQRSRRTETGVGRVMKAIEGIEKNLRAPRPGRSELIREAIEILGRPAGRIPRLQRKPPRKLPWFGVVAAALVVAGALAYFLMREEPAAVPDPTGSGAWQIARISHADASVSVKRRGSAAPERAVAGFPLSNGDLVETGAGRALIEVGTEAVLYANAQTALRLSSVQAGGSSSVVASMDVGEVYVDEDQPRIHVETPDGWVTPRGTRFNVRRAGEATQVVVRDGSVDVRTKSEEKKRIGEAVLLREGKGTQVTRGAALAPLSDQDVKSTLGWIQETRQPGRLLCAFESAEELKIFENLALRTGEAELVRAHATGGTRSLRWTVRAGATRSFAAAQWLGLPSDWSGYGFLAFDVEARIEKATTVYVDIRDARNKGLDFKQRSVQAVTLRPGANSVRLPIRGLRTNDGTRAIEMNSIWMLLINWDGASPGDYYVDSLLLTP